MVHLGIRILYQPCMPGDKPERLVGWGGDSFPSRPPRSLTNLGYVWLLIPMYTYRAKSFYNWIKTLFKEEEEDESLCKNDVDFPLAIENWDFK